MRLAFARAGLGFFGAIIITTLVIVAMNGVGENRNEEVTMADAITAILIVLTIAFVLAGTIFFYELSTYEKEMRELENSVKRQELLERQQAMPKKDGG